MNTVQRLAGGLRTRSVGKLLVELTLLVVGILLALAVDGVAADGPIPQGGIR